MAYFTWRGNKSGGMSIRTDVTIAVNGRFHALDAAESLVRLGKRVRLIQTYPSQLVPDSSGIQEIISFSEIEVAKQLFRRLPSSSLRSHLDWQTRRWYQHRLQREFFEGVTSEFHLLFAGAGSEAIERIQNHGLPVFLDRGSTHAVAQIKQLEIAYTAAGFHPPRTRDQRTQRFVDEYETASFVLVPSKVVRKSFLEQGYQADRLIVIPYGVDVGLFSATERSTPKKFVIGFMGDFNLRKGAALALKALDHLDPNRFILKVIGTVSTEAQTLIQRRTSAVPIVSKRVPHHQVPSELKQLHLQVLPSYEEGMSLSLLQGAATGLPLVISPYTGVDDVLDRRTISILEEMSGEALARAILDCTNDYEARADGAYQAASSGRPAMSWDRYAGSLWASMQKRVS